MQELVVGVPPVWICLLRWVAREVLVYIYAVEDAEAKEAEEARVQGDWGSQRGPSDQGDQA